MKHSVSAHISIAIPYRAVTTGQNWQAVRGHICHWKRENAEALPFGSHEVRIDQVPFQLRVSKRSDLSKGVYFSRIVDENDYALVSSVARLVELKANKLAQYQRQGFTTILLLESDDIAMMNHIALHEAMMAAFPRGWPESVDDVWYANTTLWPEAQFFDMRTVASDCGQT
jgi:hypothetical protein